MAIMAIFLRRSWRNIRRLSDCDGATITCESSVAVASTLSTPSAADTHAWVDQRVGEVDDDVRHHKQHRAEEHEAEHDIEIGRQHGVERLVADSRDAKESLSEEGACRDPRQRKADDGDH